MLRNDRIQAALIAYLKSKSDITDELDDTDEIREDQWQGTEFSYPNIRLRLISNTPLPGTGCHNRMDFSVMTFSESPSSLEADQIAGIINSTLNDKSFISNNIAFSTRTTNLVPAIRESLYTWRSEVLLAAVASG